MPKHPYLALPGPWCLKFLLLALHSTFPRRSAFARREGFKIRQLNQGMLLQESSGGRLIKPHEFLSSLCICLLSLSALCVFFCFLLLFTQKDHLPSGSYGQSHQFSNSSSSASLSLKPPLKASAENKTSPLSNGGPLISVYPAHTQYPPQTYSSVRCLPSRQLLGLSFVFTPALAYCGWAFHIS